MNCYRSLKHIIAILGLSFSVSQIGTVSAWAGGGEGQDDPANLRLQELVSYPTALSFPTESVIVAVIDTGVSLPWPLKKQVLAGTNIVNPIESSADKYGHGTAVAGVVLEIAPNARILPIMAAGDGSADIQSLVDGMVYAINHGAKIINVSMECPLELLDEVERVVGAQKVKDTLFIFAAGNSGDEYRFGVEETPENVLVVGATELNSSRIADYSVWGRGVEIAAPSGAMGDGIWTYKANPENERRSFNGSSGAAPVVAGAAALLLARRPGFSAMELKKELLQSSCPLPTLKNIIEGARMLNIGRLLKQSSSCGN